MTNGNGLSASDVALLSGSNNRGYNDGFGGDWGAWIILFLIFGMFGWGGFGGFGGFGGNNSQGALTRGELCQDMNFQSVETAIRGVQQGLSDGFYAMNTGMLNGFYGLQNSIQSGFAGVDNAVCNLGFQTQQGFNNTNIALMQGQNALSTQLAQCCCENRAGQADIKYQMATDTCAIQNTIQNTTRDIIDNNNCNTRSILDFLVQDKISTLQAENQNLKLAASQVAQNEYLVNQLRPCPVPAYVTCNPWAASYGIGLNNGYGYGNGGCNSGCGCA